MGEPVAKNESAESATRVRLGHATSWSLLRRDLQLPYNLLQVYDKIGMTPEKGEHHLQLYGVEAKTC